MITLFTRLFSFLTITLSACNSLSSGQSMALAAGFSKDIEFRNVLFTFDSRKRSTDDNRVFNITDCSNENYICLSSAEIDIILPKDCDDINIDSVYRVNNSSVRVLSIIKNGPSSHPGMYTVWIASDKSSNIMYSFSDDLGLNSVVVAPDGVDVVTMAETGALYDYFRNNPESRSWRRGRVSPDRLLTCGSEFAPRMTPTGG